MSRNGFIATVALLIIVALPLAMDETEDMSLYYQKKAIALMLLVAAYAMIRLKNKIVRKV